MVEALILQLGVIKVLEQAVLVLLRLMVQRQEEELAKLFIIKLVLLVFQGL